MKAPFQRFHNFTCEILINIFSRVFLLPFFVIQIKTIILRQKMKIIIIIIANYSYAEIDFVVEYGEPHKPQHTRKLSFSLITQFSFG